MSGSFEYLKINTKIQYKDIKDEDLVKIAQKDIDDYRSKCNWSCSVCKKSVSYTESLNITGENYIHDVRSYMLKIDCPKFSSCKKKMDLVKVANNSFNSSAFNELFARYQPWIIHESEKAKSIDSPEEIYGELCSAFSKIVGMFARVGEFSKTSEKWFSSFFYKSIKNKISDIQKTKNYQKRSPLIKCEVCGQHVGKITSKHLMLEGHESFIKDLYISIGKDNLINSGEIKYYINDNELINRSFILGIMICLDKNKNKNNKFLTSKALSYYFDKFPNAKTKNNLLSLNAPIDEEESSTIEDTICESVTLSGNTNIINDISIEETISEIISIFYKNNKNVIDKMFKLDMNEIKIKEILKEILFDKMSHGSIKNSEIDRSYGEYVKDGFTSKVLRMIRSDKECVLELNSI